MGQRQHERVILRELATDFEAHQDPAAPEGAAAKGARLTDRVPGAGDA
ncbi:hypothetical protein [Streptomyces lichenis]|uniref:Uncharacterized protein n=1 Tax=Streptomyces lichenis TaxID=2306967 RepID=A0ABT0IFZ3_9ACTN|nr:hypothetical protein [Streptomyces lichenis]MCK8680239.1 hypothetical protein [Streptomyces lichenis]